MNSTKADEQLAERLAQPARVLAGVFWEEMVQAAMALRDLCGALRAPCPSCGKLPGLHLTGDPPSVHLECTACHQHVVDGGKVSSDEDVRDGIAGAARIWLRDHRGQP